MMERVGFFEHCVVGSSAGGFFGRVSWSQQWGPLSTSCSLWSGLSHCEIGRALSFSLCGDSVIEVYS